VIWIILGIIVVAIVAAVIGALGAIMWVFKDGVWKV